MRLRRILVPVDFSPGSRGAVQYARGIAAQFGSYVHVLHAITPGTSRPCNPSLAPLASRMRALHHLSALMAAENLDPFHTTGVVRLGPADEVIARYADEIHADLIVMGLHGDHRSSDRGVGDIAARVLDRTECPVLAVPDQRVVERVLAKPLDEQPLAS
jgi:universal stress protein A